ncbi:hypothetical protein BASA50_008631 [Batrachochytrium salamandrivorans]|uniref:SWIM-type domain-containing protein n=1 Tax=Batrachochytrium salamandrivorans TaxID=1357716 RepID=A0ABQ8F3M7_9FUNG|nr:hypothetical protein BASA50_008631 [Batrachochytrium salamandrivorans]
MRLQTTEVLSTVPYVRPSSLINLARLKHGVTFLYSSAWRALQCHRQDISKADVISFGKIPYFLHGIEIANPGSTTYVAVTSEASAHDGDNHIIPIAIGLYDIDNELNWKHFFLKLAETIPEIKQPKFVIIFKSKFGGHIWAAAKTSSQVKYDKAMATIAAINCDAAEYLKNLDLKSRIWGYWPAGYPIQLASYTVVNKNMRMQTPFLVLDHFARSIKNRDNRRQHQMFQTGDHLFEVTSLTSGYTRIVNLATKTCSCMEFQEMQLPCAHAALAISTHRQPVNQFVDRSYLLSSLQSVYSQQIVSVDLDTINCDEALQPPNVVRKAGRPRKVRLRSRGEVDDNDRYACKGCGLLGHNVQTCSRRQPPSVLHVDLEEGNPRTIPAAGYWKFKWRFRVKENSCLQCCVYQLWW